MIGRDGKGQTIACHDSDGTAFAARSYGARFVANGVPCIPLSGGIVGRGGSLTNDPNRRLIDSWNTIQGVRSYDTQAGVWNTPDAYKGDVHDPMSQKPYMWNGNNPYEYSDPSGFDWHEAEVSAKALLRLIASSPFVGTLIGIGVATSHRAGDGGSAESGGVLYKIGSNGLAHTAEAHFDGGKNAANKSLFSPGTTKADVTKMVEQAVTAGTAELQKGAGSYKTFSADIGYSIGTDKNGTATSEIKVVFDSNNEMKSAYPISPGSAMRPIK